MSGEEPTNVEFVYDASFYFDDLPNNKKQSSQEIEQQQGKRKSKLPPKWYQAAKAPVPFSEDVFWKVLERWILEAPSIIPPISKVEIIQDHTHEEDKEDNDHINKKDSDHVPSTKEIDTSYCTRKDRVELLKESKVPFRAIQRRLLPKRAKKDPVMEEQLFYIRSQQTSHAVFAPLVKISSTSTDRAAAEDNDDDDEQIKAMMETLPFYYPKVRGFRYGYIPDLEEYPEDRDDHDHDHDQELQAGDASFEYEHNDCCADETKTSGKSGKVAKKVMSKRVGWITLDLFLSGDEGEFTDKMQYAFKELFKKLYKWGVNTTKGFTKSRVQHDVMVPKELYLSTYARIKERHAQKWVQSWPEKTDPRKFVFEDIAIASWLIALWELERRTNNQEPEEGKKQTFVDMGCGNGLLTNILNEEGHKGTGIDIVARKVWDIYGPKTQLEAKTVIPNETAFENVDWIIGNHADELAPWIPIIAMRSKPLTRFVVIPCCFFDLNGSRYQFPKGAPEGKYKAYQDYICNIIHTCNYDLQTEILRIPSTKNVALVGMTRKRKRGNETEDEDEGENDCRLRVDELVSRSGLFVARVSDKDKQALQKTKHAAKLLAREGEAEQEQEQNELEQKTLEKST